MCIPPRSQKIFDIYHFYEYDKCSFVAISDVFSSVCMFRSADEKLKARAEHQTGDVLKVDVVALAPQEELVNFRSLLVCTLRRTLTSEA